METSSMDTGAGVGGRWRLAAAALFLGLFVYDGIVRPLVSGIVALPTIPGGLRVLTVILLLFSLFHASYALGSRLTILFFATTAVTSWLFEEIGVATGLVYGPYHYTETLGPWIGSVPILIPLAWFMMVYPSYVVANVIVDGRPIALRLGLGHLLGLSVMAALVMTAWDLLIDPILSGPLYQAWIWEAGGPYHGVPVRNYLGWFATTFTVQLLFRLAEQRWRPQPAGRLTLRAASLPLAAYASMLVAHLLSNLVPPGAEVAGSIGMGIPVVAAGLRLLRDRASMGGGR
jgi:putative membrane protein